jgi:hypothetical protein
MTKIEDQKLNIYLSITSYYEDEITSGGILQCFDRMTET